MSKPVISIQTPLAPIQISSQFRFLKKGGNPFLPWAKQTKQTEELNLGEQVFPGEGQPGKKSVVFCLGRRHNIFK
jgi:hypothetical protein